MKVGDKFKWYWNDTEWEWVIYGGNLSVEETEEDNAVL